MSGMNETGDRGGATEGFRVAIVDNDRFTRLALADVVAQGGHEVIWTRGSGLIAPDLVAAPETKPDVLLLDMSLGTTTGPQVCRAIRRRMADVAVLGVTAFPPSQYAAELAAAGAQGLVTKDTEREVLAGIAALAHGGTYCPDVPGVRFLPPVAAWKAVNGLGTEMEHRNGAADGRARLTEREEALMRVYEADGSLKTAAKVLGMGQSTARNTMANIRRKLGVTGTAQALVAWHERQRSGR